MSTRNAKAGAPGTDAPPAIDPASISEHVKAQILIEALPYIQSLAGKTVVIKYGGNAMLDEALKTSVMADVTLLKFIGLNPIVVHGGGPDISGMLERLSIESEFIDGLRVTGADTMDVAQMVLIGRTNKDIVARLQRQGARAVGLSGIDGRLLQCRPLKRVKDGRAIDYGFVGEITQVNADVLDSLIAAGYIPVIAPIGVDDKGQSYNINADTVAAEVAVAVGAEKLMTLTDVSGVRRSRADGTEEVLHVLSEAEITSMIDKGEISGGMIPKVRGCLDVIERGVNRAHIIDGRVPHCLLLEIFTHRGIGTMITKRIRPYHAGEKL